MTMASYKQQNIAIACLLYTATMWGLIWFPLRYFADQGMNGLWATLFIYLGTGITFYPLLKGRLSELKNQSGILLGILIASGITNTAFMLAMIDGQVVRVLLLFYLSPVWAMLLGYLLLDEKVSGINIAAALFGLLGVAIMLWDKHIGIPYPQSVSDWLALTSGFAFATTNVFIRKARAVSIQVKSVISWVGVIIISGAIILLIGSPLIVIEPHSIYIALGIGAICIVSMTLAVVYGVSHLPMQRSAIILLFEVVVGAVSAYILAGESMSLREWVGGLLVIATAVVVAREKQNA